MRFGRLFEGVVVEVSEPPPGRTIEDSVGEEQAVNYFAIPDHVGEGYSKDVEGNWVAPTTTT